MKFIKTRFFDNQVQELSKKYIKIFDDLNEFEKDYDVEPFLIYEIISINIELKTHQFQHEKEDDLDLLLRFIETKSFMLQFIQKH